MSVNFNATKILILDADATETDHNGRVYRNDDFPKDTVLCVDAGGNVYKYDMQMGDERSPNHWPLRDAKTGIPLFRNYWTFLYNPNELTGLGPYYSSIEKTQKTTVLPPIGINKL